MISLSQASQLTQAAVNRLDSEVVTLANAVGRVLASDAVSDMDMPPFDKSSMDGYALRSKDVENAPVELAVAGKIAAGVYPDFEIAAGQSAKIMTGAPMPAGSDSVQQVEKTTESGGKVKILESVKPGQNVASRGDVMRAGQTVLREGTAIDPAVVGLLAAIGVAEVPVYRQPRVGILITGDELVDVSAKPLPGQIRDSNGPTLRAQTLAAGALPRMLGVAADDIDDLRRGVQAGLSNDVLILSGGVSMGDYDFVEEVFVELGVEVLYNKIRVKPGKPTVFGRRGQTLVFGLPGNPVSASTIFELLVRPALLKMMGSTVPHHLRAEATLLSDFASKTNRENYHPASTHIRDGRFCTEPVASRGSADILAFARSNSFIVAPPEQDVFRTGDVIQILFRAGMMPCFNEVAA